MVVRLHESAGLRDDGVKNPSPTRSGVGDECAIYVDCGDVDEEMSKQGT